MEIKKIGKLDLLRTLLDGAPEPYKRYAIEHLEAMDTWEKHVSFLQLWTKPVWPIIILMLISSLTAVASWVITGTYSPSKVLLITATIAVTWALVTLIAMRLEQIYQKKADDKLDIVKNYQRSVESGNIIDLNMHRG